MTIKYLDSKRVSGLSTDTPTFEDTTFSSGWTLGSGSKIVTGTNEIEINYDADGTAHTLYHDLGSTLSDTKWVMDFDLDVTSINARATVSSNVAFGISSITGNSDDNQDGIFIVWNLAAGLVIYGSSPNGESISNAVTGAFTHTPIVETIYVRMIRTSDSNYTFSLYSDSGRTSLIESVNYTNAAGSTDLQYVKIVGNARTDANGLLTATLDNLKIWNNVTTPSIKPTDIQDNSIFVETDTARRYWFDGSTWTIAPTFEDNFTTSSQWTQTGSNITISGNQLTWNGDNTASSHGLHHDMGANRVSSSKWILDFDFILDNYSAGSSLYTHALGVMLTDTDSTSGTYGSDATRDYIGMRLRWRTDTAAQYRKFYAIDDNGSTQTWASNVPYNVADDATSQGFPTAGTTYKIRIARLTTTTYKVEISNSSGTLLDTLNGTCSNSSDLRYILVQSYGGGDVENPNFDGKIDNMKFYDGVTSI